MTGVRRATKWLRSVSILLPMSLSAACGRSGASPAAASATAPSAHAAPQSKPSQSAVPALTSFLQTQRFLGKGCALDREGLAWCWRNPMAEAGSAQALVPRRTPELDRAKDVQSTGYFSYILRDGGDVYVWGKEPHPHLGDVKTPRALPAPRRVKQIASGGTFITLLTESGEVWSLSDTLVTPDPGEPGKIVSQRPELVRKEIAALSSPLGTSFLDAAGRVLVRHGAEWKALPELEKATFIADGAFGSCTIIAERVECWGSDASYRFALTPHAALSTLSLSIGDVYALGQDGRVWLSLASTIPRELIPVGGIVDVAELSPGAGTLQQPSCFRLRDNRVGCWGKGEGRSVGSGSWPERPALAMLRKNEDASRNDAPPPKEH